ncbi:phospholipase, putative, partial [Plasmodium ovale curtisi]
YADSTKSINASQDSNSENSFFDHDFSDISDHTQNINMTNQEIIKKEHIDSGYNESEKNKTMPIRYDYQLQEFIMEHYIYPLAVAKSHFNYFIIKDISFFILKELINKETPISYEEYLTEIEKEYNNKSTHEKDNTKNIDKTTSYFNQYDEEKGQTNPDEENISDYNNKFEIDNNFYNFIADINFNNSSSSNDSEGLKKRKSKKISGRSSSRDGIEHDNMRSQLNSGISPNDNNPQSDISQTRNKNKSSSRNTKNKNGVIINDNKNNASTQNINY